MSPKWAMAAGSRLARRSGNIAQDSKPINQLTYKYKLTIQNLFSIQIKNHDDS
jgi:hypothetical protein